MGLQIEADCGHDRLCPGNVPEEGELANNGLDDDFDGVIDDGAYPGPDEGEGNGRYDGLWQAGFGSNIPSLGVHDPIWARCFAVERGDTSVVICSLDLVGFFWDDVERAALSSARSGRSGSRSHPHLGDPCPRSPGFDGTVGPDHQRQRRPAAQRGVNPDHIELIRNQTAQAIQRR